MKTGRLLVFMMLAAFIARVPLCLQPPETLIPKVVSDDMFYYLCIARSIAGGHGATADGVHATNGFHPLWALLLVSVVQAAGERHAVQAALLLLTVFSVLSAWCIRRILAACRCGEGASLVAAVVWLCSPYPVLIALTGVEAPLYVLALGIAAWAYLRIGRGRGAPRGAWAGLGLLAGAAVLARLDGAVLAAVIALDMAVGAGARGAPVGARLRRVAAFAGACLLACLPWFLWSYARTGCLLQMSGSAIRHQQQLFFQARNADAAWGAYALSWLSSVAHNAAASFGTIAAVSGLSASAVLALAAVCLLLAGLAAMKDPPVFRDRLRRYGRLAFLFVYGALIFLLYCAYLWYHQDWYFYSVVFAVAVCFGCVLDLLAAAFLSGLPRLVRAIAWAAGAVCCAAFFTLKTAAWWEGGMRGWQLDMYRAARWAAENLPPDARIGSFNSGIAAWYCPQTVINLDGVVNGAAYRAITAGRIFDYVREERITHLIESPLSLRFRAAQAPLSPPPPLRDLHVEASYPEARRRGNPVIVYEVRGAGEAR